MCDIVIFPSFNVVEDASSAQYHIGQHHISFSATDAMEDTWEIKLICTDGILAPELVDVFYSCHQDHP